MRLEPQRTRIHALVLLAAMLSAPVSADETWNGNLLNNNWSTDANWASGKKPAQGEDQKLTFTWNNGAGRVSNQNIADSFEINAIILQNNPNVVNGFVLKGKRLLFDGDNPKVQVENAVQNWIRNPITIHSDLTLTADRIHNRPTRLTGAIGDFDFIVDDPRSVTITAGHFSLEGANTYRGGTILSGGKLLVTNDKSLGSGKLTLGGGHLVPSKSKIKLPNDIILKANTKFGESNTKRTLTLKGDVEMQASKSIEILGRNTVIFEGDFFDKDNNRDLAFEGPGKAVLRGLNNYTGETTVNGGTLRVEGALGSKSKPTEGGTLNKGRVEVHRKARIYTKGQRLNQVFWTRRNAYFRVTAQRPIVQRVDTNEAPMIDGGLFMEADSILEIELSKAENPGEPLLYSRLDLFGTLVLGDQTEQDWPILDLSVNTRPEHDDVFTIIDMQEGPGYAEGYFKAMNPHSGLYETLYEGSTLHANFGSQFLVSYAEGDLTLTTLVAPTPAPAALFGLAALRLVTRRRRR